MTAEESLQEALLRQDDGKGTDDAPPDPGRVIRQVRRRQWWWAAVSVALWVITAGYLVALWFVYMLFIHPRIHEHLKDTAVDQGPTEAMQRLLLMVLKALLVWPGLLMLAAACTTWLVLSSRRATLAQIQASLAGISDQLRSAGSEKQRPG